MRDVNDPDAPSHAPERAGWLHFDALSGVTGEMVIAALLDLGLPVRVVNEAFARADLISLGVRVERSRRGSVGGTLVTFVDGQGRALVSRAEGRRAAPRARRAGRRRGPAPHPAHRHEEPAAVAQNAEGEDGDEGAAADVLLGPHGEEGGPVPAVGAVARWLSGQPAPAGELLGRLLRSSLPPLAKAVAHKALRRLLEAHAAVAGDALDDHTLDGDEAVQALCVVVAFGALLEELSPARVTATPVLVELGARPEIHEVLAGARVREEELDFEATTPLGAALLWAVCHRFGPRGDLVPGRSGRGLGPVHRRGRVHALSASVGPAPGVTREGGARVEVRARLDASVDPRELSAALTPHGARDVALVPVSTERGPGLELVLSAERAHADGLTEELWRRGALRVRLLEAEERSPEAREVTVAVGRGNKKVPVRVAEARDGGVLLWREPRAEDVTEAAAQLLWPAGVVRDEALALAAERQGPDETE